ncbi:unnamed protein product [Amoebophrya sp. A120]|nr:unnamed protein product [Amoebophrya sp. A120]|eukprot:GSA120T00018190001.1
MRSRRPSMALLVALALPLCRHFLVQSVSAEIFTGTVRSSTEWPVVVAKFVYDYNPACFPPSFCRPDQYPGELDLTYEVTTIADDGTTAGSSSGGDAAASAFGSTTNGNGANSEAASSANTLHSSQSTLARYAGRNAKQEDTQFYFGLLDDEIAQFPRLFPAGTVSFLGSPTQSAYETCDQVFNNVAGNWLRLEQGDGEMVKVTDDGDMGAAAVPAGAAGMNMNNILLRGGSPAISSASSKLPSTGSTPTASQNPFAAWFGGGQSGGPTSAEIAGKCTATWSVAFANQYLLGCVPNDNCKPWSTMEAAKRACIAQGPNCGGIVGAPTADTASGGSNSNIDAGQQAAAPANTNLQCRAFSHAVNHWEIREGREVLYAKDQNDLAARESKEIAYKKTSTNSNTAITFAPGEPCAWLANCVAGDECKKYYQRSDAERACIAAGETCGGIVSRPCGGDSRIACDEESAGRLGSSSPIHPENIHHWEIRRGASPMGHTQEVSYLKHMSLDCDVVPATGSSETVDGDGDAAVATLQLGDASTTNNSKTPFVYLKGRHRQSILQKCRRRVWHFLFLACSDRPAAGGDTTFSTITGQPLYEFKYTIRARNTLNGWETELGADENQLFPILLFQIFFLGTLSWQLRPKMFSISTASSNVGGSTSPFERDLNYAFAGEFFGPRAIRGKFSLTGLVQHGTFILFAAAVVRAVDYPLKAFSGQHFAFFGFVDFTTIASLVEAAGKACLNLIFLFCASQSPSQIRRSAARFVSQMRKSSNLVDGSTSAYAGGISLISTSNSATSYYIRNLAVLFFICNVILDQWSRARHLKTLTTVYQYDTAPGEIVVLLDVAMLVLVCFLLFRSFYGDPRYRSRLFFLRYGGLFLFWFATLPAVAIIAPHVDPWVRKRTAFIISALSLDFGVYLANHLVFGCTLILPNAQKNNSVSTSKSTTAGLYEYVYASETFQDEDNSDGDFVNYDDFNMELIEPGGGGNNTTRTSSRVAATTRSKMNSSSHNFHDGLDFTPEKRPSLTSTYGSSGLTNYSSLGGGGVLDDYGKGGADDLFFEEGHALL